MDLLLRDINPGIVKAIEERAKKNKQSRQEYLKNMIENYIMLKDFNDRESELKESLEKNTKIIHLLHHQLEKNNTLLEELTEEEVIE